MLLSKTPGEKRAAVALNFTSPAVVHTAKFASALPAPSPLPLALALTRSHVAARRRRAPAPWPILHAGAGFGGLR